MMKVLQKYEILKENMHFLLSKLVGFKRFNIYLKFRSTKNEYVNERLQCDTMKVGSDLDSKGYGIATRLGSDLTEAINIIITNLRESGFLDKLKQRWWYERSECPKTAKDKRFSELTLSSVTGLFYIFLFGIILSIFIVFTEFLITAKHESDTLNIDMREILRIKMIEYVLFN